jgi:AP endonuclease-1
MWFLNTVPKLQYGLDNGDSGVKEFNSEGRLITAEFDKFFVVTTYVPNAGAKLVTLPKRMKWDPMFRQDVTRQTHN